MTRRFLPASGLSLALLAFVACSSTTINEASTGGADGGPGAGDDGGGVTGETGTTADGGTKPSAEIPPPSACPTAKYKTIVIVGDSISDVGGGGGAGEQPFYRTLLVKNDDALYPEWKGFDLATCWALDPTMNVVKASKGGAVASVPSPNDAGNKGILLNQVTALPATLPGPVLVVGTIGGNDVQRGLVTLLTGKPAQVQAQVDAFAAGFGLAMANLTKADRFGAGVKTDVLMTNVYDPSGGTGHFYYEPKGATCPGALAYWPDNQETATSLVQWNTAMATEAAKYAGVTLLELSAPFAAHAVATPAATNWFYQDCIHPSSLGHNAVRGVFWAGMVALK